MIRSRRRFQEYNKIDYIRSGCGKALVVEKLVCEIEKLLVLLKIKITNPDLQSYLRTIQHKILAQSLTCKFFIEMIEKRIEFTKNTHTC
jgi:hypothetical protein